MEGLLPFVLIGLLIVACPLVMAGMGVGAWLIARARGENKELSKGCMGDHGEYQQPMTEETELKEQVARLELEIETLSAQVKAAREDGVRPEGELPAGKVNSESAER